MQVVGQVADGRYDVEPADAPGREAHRQEGDDRAQAEGDHDATQLDVALQAEAARAKQAGHDRDHAQSHADAQQHADQRCAEVVGVALKQELFDQVAALGADGARHAHLGAPLGGQHHEDQEDQHDARGDREQAEDDEYRREGGAELVGCGEPIALECLHAVVAERDQRRAQRRHDRRVLDAAQRLDDRGVGEQALELIARSGSGRLSLEVAHLRQSVQRAFDRGRLLERAQRRLTLCAAQRALSGRGRRRVDQLRAYRAGDRIAQGGLAAGDIIATVGNEDGGDLPGVAGQLLQPVERQQYRGHRGLAAR